MVFSIEITETLQRQIQQEGNSPEEAMEKVRRAYENSEIVLDDGDHICTEFAHL